MGIKMKNLSLYIAVLVMIALTMYVRFSNPELTETQLLIQYWYVYLVLLITVIATVFKSEKK